MKFRKEYDSIGRINVPNDKYWGASTERSKKFFDIGEVYVQKILIKSIAIIKKAAAIVHKKEKQIKPNIAIAIIKASNEVISGKLDDNFPLSLANWVSHSNKYEFKRGNFKQSYQIFKREIRLKKTCSS